MQIAFLDTRMPVVSNGSKFCCCFLQTYNAEKDRTSLELDWHSSLDARLVLIVVAQCWRSLAL